MYTFIFQVSKQIDYYHFCRKERKKIVQAHKEKNWNEYMLLLGYFGINNSRFYSYFTKVSRFIHML